MPRTCTICNHDERQSIEASLLEGHPYRSIARRFSISAPALYRHKLDHVAESLQRAREADDVVRANALINHVRVLHARTEELYAETAAILTEAKRSKDLRTAIAAIKEAGNLTRESRGNIQLLAQLCGLLTNAPPQQQIRIVLPPRQADVPPPESFAIPIALPARSLP